MSLEKQIGIAAKLYEMRRTAWKIFGEDTPKTLEPWKATIRHKMSVTGKDEILAALALAEEAKGKDREGVRIMLMMAAVVEMIEPTQTQPS